MTLKTSKTVTQRKPRAKRNYPCIENPCETKHECLEEKCCDVVPEDLPVVPEDLPVVPDELPVSPEELPVVPGEEMPVVPEEELLSASLPENLEEDLNESTPKKYLNPL